MRKNILLIMALVFTLSLTACGDKKEEAVAEQNTQTENEVTQEVEVVEEEVVEEDTLEEEIVEEEISGINDDGIGEEISGINDDGIGEEISGINDDDMGYDPSYGEGIGEVLALTPEEESYMLSQDTNSWLALSREQKDELVVLIGRTLEATDGFIVPDYDEMVSMLDFQLEKYFRNGVNENLLYTVRDIYNIH